MISVINNIFNIPLTRSIILRCTSKNESLSFNLRVCISSVFISSENLRQETGDKIQASWWWTNIYSNFSADKHLLHQCGKIWLFIKNYFSGEMWLVGWHWAAPAGMNFFFKATMWTQESGRRVARRKTELVADPPHCYRYFSGVCAVAIRDIVLISVKFLPQSPIKLLSIHRIWIHGASERAGLSLSLFLFCLDRGPRISGVTDSRGHF